jgi:GNAT superfamily N-acetyltransferase
MTSKRLSHAGNSMIKECKNAEDIQNTHSVMMQLRPHHDDKIKYTNLVQKIQKEHGYRLIGFFNTDNICFGAAGFTIETRLFAGKILYVADLVVESTRRSSGVGKQLMAWLENEAKHQACTNVFLDSGVQRAEAHKFYFREGFHVACFNFKRPVD